MPKWQSHLILPNRIRKIDVKEHFAKQLLDGRVQLPYKSVDKDPNLRKVISYNKSETRIE